MGFLMAAHQPAHSAENVRPQKLSGRWVVERPAPDASPSCGTKLTFTRKGVEVVGWFDHFCGTGDGWSLTWAEIGAIRSALIDGEATP